MSTVIIVRAIDGEPVGQCAAHCYNADPHTICRCVCGGLNHGVGRVRAMANGRDLARQHERTTVHPEVDQMLIPGLDE